MRKKPINYTGGKNALKEEIISRFCPHRCYVDLFFGGASILFSKPKSTVEVVNDLDYLVSNVYRQVQKNHTGLIDFFKWELVTEERFKEYKKKLKDPTLEPVLQAAYYIYVNLTSFNSIGNNFGRSKKKQSNLDPLTMGETLEMGHQRLARVTIENKDYKEIIKMYDSAETLFYADPPYTQARLEYYENIFTEDDFREMATLLSGIEGKFILSIDDNPLYTDIFNRFHIEKVKTVYKFNHKKSKFVTELLISNYPTKAGSQRSLF